MLRALLYGAGDLRLEETPLDPTQLAPDQIYVETQVSGLSTGTDLGNFLGDSTYVPGAPQYPRWVGYSNAGIVRAVGSAVTAFAPGDAVFAAKPHQSAYIAPVTDLIVKIPPGLAPEIACLCYLTELNLAALQQVGFVPGEDVAVVGLGIIGFGGIGLARAMGARRVIAVANQEGRAALATRLGATHSYCTGRDDAALAALKDNGADVILLLANSWDAYKQSLELARRNGRVAVLGFPGRLQPPPDFNPLSPDWIYRKQLGIFGSGQTRDVPRNLAYVLDLLAAGRMDIRPAISHHVPARDLVSVYELARSKDKSLTGAVFDWRS
ncbi:MAG: zinc-binding alcohol dehydrogenase [Acidobacteria bacterium]|nr:zinc-binding alcohol dehydrogenase [Acidobacteriota bacterium]